MMSPSRTRARARRDRLRRIFRLLEKEHGPRPLEPRDKCLDMLVQAMLAQNTSMPNADRGYRQLRRTFNTWTKVMNAPFEQVQRSIAICGLARMRARRLQDMLRLIKERHLRLDLEFLGDYQPHDAFEYLLGFYGIGPKTAAYTLLFSFNMPLFPVDKGIWRMSRRLRLVRAKAGELETSRAIESIASPAMCYPLHLLMFTNAKKFCRPRNPKCRECPLLKLCTHGERHARHRPPTTADPVTTRRPRPIILARHASAGIPPNDDAAEPIRRIIRPAAC
jgi:endonuclease-3